MGFLNLESAIGSKLFCLFVCSVWSGRVGSGLDDRASECSRWFEPTNESP